MHASLKITKCNEINKSFSKYVTLKMKAFPFVKTVPDINLDEDLSWLVGNITILGALLP